MRPSRGLAPTRGVATAGIFEVVNPSPRERARRILDLLRTTEGVEALEDAIARELEAAGPSTCAPQAAGDDDRRREREVVDRALTVGGDALTARILDAVPGGVVVVSTAGAVLKANAEAVRILGLSWDALTHRFVADFGSETYHEDGSPCPPEDYPVSRCLATGQPQPARLIGVRQPGGDVVWAVFRAVPLAEPDRGVMAGVVVTFIDVTDRKRAEEAAWRSQERFRTLVESWPDHIVVVDPEARILFLNRSGVEGARAEDLLGRTCFELSPPSTHEAMRAAITAAFERGEPSRFSGDDTFGRSWESQVIPLRDDAGRVSQAMFVSSDTTDRRRAEEERRRLDQSLMEAQRLGSLAVFAGGIAHDFNNLLVGIRGNLELAQQRAGPAGPVRPLLEDARRAATHASELIDQLLAYSGQRSAPAEALDVNTLAEDMAQLARATVAKDAALRLQLAPALPAVEGDATQVRQVLMNLLSNAAEARGGPGGTVSLRTSVADLDQVRAMANALAPVQPTVGAYVVVEVHDDGAGMTPETRARIFDPFFSTKFTGRGLGLAAVMGIVRAHRGAIGVESAPGAGSTFRVALPAGSLPAPGRAPTPTAAAATPPEPPAARRPVVLVIDDEKHVRSVAKIALEDAGFQVLTAADGAQGVAMFASHADDVRAILLDLLMPDMDGDEAFAALREVRADVPIVLSSGLGEESAVGRFLDKGLAGFLKKPYHLDELVTLVQRVAR